MKIMTLVAFTLLSATGTSRAGEDITDRIQEMRKFSDQQQRAQQHEQYQQYLKNNDASNGISQRTGPTGGLTKGGAWGGYQWSTK